MLTSETKIAVRYAETDMMGIVYHGNYLPWFEVGRTKLMKELGMPYRELEEQGLFLPVLEVGARYIKSAVYDDEVTIITSWKKKAVLRIRLEYEVKRGEELLATGFTEHVFVDKRGKAVRLPEVFVKKMNEVFGE